MHALPPLSPVWSIYFPLPHGGMNASSLSDVDSEAARSADGLLADESQASVADDVSNDVMLGTECFDPVDAESGRAAAATAHGSVMQPAQALTEVGTNATSHADAGSQQTSAGAVNADYAGIADIMTAGSGLEVDGDSNGADAAPKKMRRKPADNAAQEQVTWQAFVQCALKVRVNSNLANVRVLAAASEVCLEVSSYMSLLLGKTYHTVTLAMSGGSISYSVSALECICATSNFTPSQVCLKSCWQAPAQPKHWSTLTP